MRTTATHNAYDNTPEAVLFMAFELKVPAQLDALRLWDGSPLPRGLRRRVLRVYTHHQFLGSLF